MYSIVEMALYYFYGGGLMEAISTYIREIAAMTADAAVGLGVSGSSLAVNLIDVGYQCLGGVACSYMILLFFVNITEMAIREVFTFEKLISVFAKLIVGIAAVLLIKEIVTGVITIGYQLFELISGTLSEGSSAAVFTDVTDSAETDIMEKLEEIGGGDGWLAQLKFFVSCASACIASILLDLTYCVCLFISILTLLSIGIKLGVRVFLSPLAIVQIYEGAQSTGIRYLKIMLADMMSFAGVILIIYVGTLFQGILSGGSYTIAGLTKDKLNEMLSWGKIPELIAIQLAVIGGIGSANRLCRDVFGV